MIANSLVGGNATLGQHTTKDQRHVESADGERGLLLVPALVCVALLLYAALSGTGPVGPAPRESVKPPSVHTQVQR